MALTSGLLMLVTAITAQAPSSNPATTTTPALTATNWTALLIDNRFAEGERPTVRFRDDGKVVGNAGCEVYVGSWTLHGETIEFTDLRRQTGQLTGPRPCSARSLDQETRFLAVLEAARVVHVQSRKLLLRDRAGTVRALLEYTEPPSAAGVRLTDRVAGPAPASTDPRHAPLSSFSFSTMTAALGRYFGTERGVLVSGAPALNDLALLEGDVILSVNGRQPGSSDHLLRILSSYRPGDLLTLQVMRDRQLQTVEVMLTEP